jgi:hypothetical protein
VKGSCMRRQWWLCEEAHKVNSKVKIESSICIGSLERTDRYENSTCNRNDRCELDRVLPLFRSGKSHANEASLKGGRFKGDYHPP